jgi:hypothetical protein
VTVPSSIAEQHCAPGADADFPDPVSAVRHADVG